MTSVLMGADLETAVVASPKPGRRELFTGLGAPSTGLTICYSEAPIRTLA